MLRKALPGDFAVAFLSSTELAQLAMAGLCEWQHADVAFHELHSKFERTAESARNAALVKTQLEQYEEAHALFGQSIALTLVPPTL